MAGREVDFSRVLHTKGQRDELKVAGPVRTYDRSLLDRDLPEPHYRVMYRCGPTLSARAWTSRQDLNYWLDHWGRMVGVVAVVRVIPKPSKSRRCHS